MPKLNCLTCTAPHSKDMEVLVLGLMLTRINCLNFVASFLKEADFYFIEHRYIFSTLLNAYCQDKPSDINLVAEELKRRGQLDDVGGIDYLLTLAQCVGTSVFIEEYAAKIQEKAILREMIQLAQEVEKKSLNEPEDVTGLLDRTQEEFFRISQRKGSTQTILVKDLLSGVSSKQKIPFLNELQDRQVKYKNQGIDKGITGLPSHFPDLDKMINGLGDSNLIILASRPAMGKTALALNIATNVALKGKAAVGIFSLEMTGEQLIERMVCAHAQVESSRIKNGAITSEEFQKVVNSVGLLIQSVVVMDDQAGLTVGDLCARARRMKERYGIKLLIIDYLQLISSGGGHKGGEYRQNEVSDISRKLKILAKELNIPVLCLSQLSREVEKRLNHRPQLSDLRESGSIEQDSDNVLLLTRAAYYEPDPDANNTSAQLIVAKNRHGAVGDITLAYRKEFALFKPTRVE